MIFLNQENSILTLLLLIHFYLSICFVEFSFLEIVTDTEVFITGPHRCKWLLQPLEESVFVAVVHVLATSNESSSSSMHNMHNTVLFILQYMHNMHIMLCILARVCQYQQELVCMMDMKQCISINERYICIVCTYIPLTSSYRRNFEFSSDTKHYLLFRS